MNERFIVQNQASANSIFLMIGYDSMNNKMLPHCRYFLENILFHGEKHSLVHQRHSLLAINVYECAVRHLIGFTYINCTAIR